MLAPSGEKSAAWTPSSISRGTPPASVERASIPVVVNGPLTRAPSETAMSPEGATASTLAGGSAIGIDSGIPARVE